MAKPRTKLEFRVTELSKRIPKLTDKEESWVFRTQFKHLGFATKNRVICMDCGETFSSKIIKRKKAICPHCETKLSIEFTRKRNYFQSGIVAKSYIVEEFQVVKHYQVYINQSKGKKANVLIFNVLDYWIDDKDKLTRLGQNRGSGFGGDNWNGNFDIKKNYGVSYYGDKYNLYALEYLPGSKFKKKYTRLGICRKNMVDLSFTSTYNHVKESSKAETILKSGDADLFYISYSSSKVDRYWNTLKIIKRHSYKVKDWSMYFDYLEFLKYFNKDLRNPKFICPENLHNAHNLYMRKKQRIEEREQRIRNERYEREKLEKEKKRIQRLENPNWYQEEKSPFIGVSYTNKNNRKVSIRFLNSPKEVKEEGEVLDHCVYASEYHFKETLLFSGMISGKKTVTIEISLKNQNVLQVRGYDNIVTEYDNEFISFVKSKIPDLIRRHSKWSKKKTKKQELAMAS